MYETRHALKAPCVKGDNYTVIHAEEDSAEVRRIVSELDPSLPEQKRRKLAKKQANAGKRFDVYSPDQEVRLHVQWKNATHASYYSHDGANASGAPAVPAAPAGAKGGKNEPMSKWHLDAQTTIRDAINEGVVIEFVMKCKRNHIIPLFRTEKGLHAKVEYNLRVKRLDVAVLDANSELVFTIEVLHSSRTGEFQRRDPWCEVVAMHVLQQFDDWKKYPERSGRPVRIVCEPRKDIAVCGDFRRRGAWWTCEKCKEEGAAECIEQWWRSVLMRRRQMEKRAAECIERWWRSVLRRRAQSAEGLARSATKRTAEAVASRSRTQCKVRDVATCKKSSHHVPGGIKNSYYFSSGTWCP